MEIRTRILSAQEFESQLEVLLGACLSVGNGELAVSFGWACNLDIDQLYEPHTLQAQDLDAFIAEHRASGAFTLGEADLHIHSDEPEFSLTLCHESDAHFESSSSDAVETVREQWAAAGLGPAPPK